MAEMLRKGEVSPAGPGLGRPWQLGKGWGVVACQVSATAWEGPSPEILIQGRNRTGFSTGNAKGDRARGSQKVRRAEPILKKRQEALAGGPVGY